MPIVIPRILPLTGALTIQTPKTGKVEFANSVDLNGGGS